MPSLAVPPLVVELKDSGYPPSRDVVWIAFLPAERRGALVRARTWYRARELGSEKLGALFGDVDAVRLDEEPVAVEESFGRRS